MRHEKVTVKRDNNTVHLKTIAPWEIPILEYLFDEGNITRTGEFVLADQDYPEPADEMLRLTKAYGVDTKTDIPFAVTVFGAARTGVRALAKAIDAAREEEDEEDQAPPATTGDRQTVRHRKTNRIRPHAGDSLLV
jgi:hypothetical protein